MNLNKLSWCGLRICMRVCRRNILYIKQNKWCMSITLIKHKHNCSLSQIFVIFLGDFFRNPEEVSSKEDENWRRWTIMSVFDINVMLLEIARQMNLFKNKWCIILNTSSEQWGETEKSRVRWLLTKFIQIGLMGFDIFVIIFALESEPDKIDPTQDREKQRHLVFCQTRTYIYIYTLDDNQERWLWLSW